MQLAGKYDTSLTARESTAAVGRGEDNTFIHSQVSVVIAGLPARSLL